MRDPMLAPPSLRGEEYKGRSAHPPLAAALLEALQQGAQNAVIKQRASIPGIVLAGFANILAASPKAVAPARPNRLNGVLVSLGMTDLRAELEGKDLSATRPIVNLATLRE